MSNNEEMRSLPGLGIPVYRLSKVKFVTPTLDRPLIMKLENHVVYYLQQVFILIEQQDRHRLLVIHFRQVLTNRVFKTLKGAMRYFKRTYGGWSWKKGARPEWGKPEIPFNPWLKSIKEALEKYPQQKKNRSKRAVL